MTRLTKIALGCGIGAFVCGTVATYLSNVYTWMMIGIMSLMLSLIRVWAERVTGSGPGRP